MTVYSQYITIFMKNVIRSAVLMGIIDCAIFNKFSIALIYLLLKVFIHVLHFGS